MRKLQVVRSDIDKTNDKKLFSFDLLVSKNFRIVISGENKDPNFFLPLNKSNAKVEALTF